MHNFNLQIYAVLAQIPSGKIVTYGDVANLAGYPRHARHVGKVLAALPKESSLPWFRVINAKGQISLNGERFEKQKERLEKDGIPVSESGAVSLRRFRWDGQPV